MPSGTVDPSISQHQHRNGEEQDREDVEGREGQRRQRAGEESHGQPPPAPQDDDCLGGLQDQDRLRTEIGSDKAEGR